MDKGEDLTDAMKDKFEDFVEEIKSEVETIKTKAQDFMKDGMTKTEKHKAN